MTDIRRIGELHLHSARVRALRVFAFAGAVFPGEWKDTYVETVTQDLLEFAYHARRVNQICSIDTAHLPPIDVTPVTLSEGNPGNWMKRYDWALDRLMHAREFVFGNAHADHRPIFTAAKSNLIPLYVRVTTDRRAEETISLFGLVDCFLNHVIPQVRERFPEWRF
jgi:hypothetical protein